MNRMKPEAEQTAEQKRERQRLTAAAAFGAIMADAEHAKAMAAGIFPPDLKKILAVRCWKHVVEGAMKQASKECPDEKLHDMSEIPWRLLADKDAREVMQKIVDEQINAFIADVSEVSAKVGTNPQNQ